MVELATWRARIGCWAGRTRTVQSADSHTDLRKMMFHLLAASLLALLLLIGGVEMNPGPNTTKMEDASSFKCPETQANKSSPGLEMDSQTALLYKKAPGAATTKGLEFEWTTAALLYLRLLNSGQKFYLATNVAGAGQLDDIVVRFQELPGQWKTLFVQLKHKETEKLSWRMLTSKKPGSKFSLPNYFKSYLEIKQAMSEETRELIFEGTLENCKIVIFTNAETSGKLEEKPVTDSKDFGQAEKFLWSGSGIVFSFETDEDMLECLEEYGDEGKEFLKQLRVFCGQTSLEKMKEALREEITKLHPDINIERICECFLYNAKIWWESSNEILHENHTLFQTAVNEVRLQICSEQTLKDNVLPLEFEDTALLKFGEGLLVHIVSSDSSCRVTLTKLLQSTQCQSLVLSAQQIAANQPALFAVNKNGDKKQLLVLANDWRSVQFDVIIEMIKILPEKFSVVLVTNENNSIGCELSKVFPGRWESYKDSCFKMAQLKPESRDKILNKEVSHQGHEITLGTVLNNDYECLEQVITASLVVDILESDDPLTVGSALPQGIGYYVERSLELPLVKTSLCQDIRGTVIVRKAQSKASAKDLFSEALDFVKSINDSSSFDQGETYYIVKKLVQSPLSFDRKDCKVFTGPKIPLGIYECYSVGLRFRLVSAVTALCVCCSNEVSQQVSFLFVSDETNEDDVIKLSEFHKSKHLFSLKNGQLFSKMSPQTAMDAEDRLVLVCAEPGMGKSTLMARLAKNTKKKFPHYFVILIALNDHTKLFAEGKHEDPLEFLSIAAKMDSPLQRSLLKFALEVSGNVVVIADGFDEIAPKYMKQSCDLLSSLLKDTKASKIWMTSRTSVKQILEKCFSKCSLRLCEFNKEEQKNFLRKYWAGKTSKEKLIALVDLLLEKSAQVMGDKEKNFLGIPLQTRMLAEVYEGHVTESAKTTELPNKLDLLSLVENFVELKYNIYFRDKLKIAADNPNEEEIFNMSRKDFIGSHAKAALILIFDNKDIKSLGLGWILTESGTFFDEITRGAYKTGFIAEIVNDKPRFIHRVFAEFFVAKWIANEFAGNNELVQSKMFTSDFTVIRHFVNGILAKDCVLHTAVLQENVEEVKTLLESEDVDVGAQDLGGRTALHLAASLGARENIGEEKRRCEILDLIIGKTKDFRVIDKVLCGSPLRYADITCWWAAIDKLLCKTDDYGQLILTLEDVRGKKMLETILQQDLDKLLGFCLNNGLEVEHQFKSTGYWVAGEKRLLVKACELGSVKVASLLLERDANINSTEIDEKVSFGPLTSASHQGHIEIVKLLCEKYVSTLVSSPLGDETVHLDASKFINTTDKFGRSAIHQAAVNGQAAVINFLKSQGGDIHRRDCYYKTPLHMAAEYNATNAVLVLLESLDETDRADAINSCDRFGKSVLHLAGTLKCVQPLIQAGGKLTLAVNSEKVTPLMTAAMHGKKDVVKWLLDNFNEEREGITLVNFIKMTDIYGRTAWERADTKCREVIENFTK